MCMFYVGVKIEAYLIHWIYKLNKASPLMSWLFVMVNVIKLCGRDLEMCFL